MLIPPKTRALAALALVLGVVLGYGVASLPSWAPQQRAVARRANLSIHPQVPLEEAPLSQQQAEMGGLHPTAPAPAPGADFHAAGPSPAAEASTHVQAPSPATASFIEDRIGRQLEELQRICPDWSYVSCETRDRSDWTSAPHTKACCHSTAVGRWSHFKLSTFNSSGHRMDRGGDTWFVKLQHVHSGSLLSTRVFDKGDGTYLVAFLPRLAGEYAVTAWLYYTRCLGYQEMPEGAMTQDPTTGVFKYGGSSAELKDYCYIGQQASLGAVVVLGEGEEPGSAGPDPRPGAAAAAAALQPGGVAGGVLRSEELVHWEGEELVVGSSPGETGGWAAAAAERIILAGDSTVRRAFVVMSATAPAPAAAQQQAQQGQQGQQGQQEQQEGGCTLSTAPHTWVSPDYREEDTGLKGWCGDLGRGDSLGGAAAGFRPVTLYPAFQACRRGRGVALSSSNERFQSYSRVVGLGEEAQDPGTLQIYYSDSIYSCISACDVYQRTLQHVRPGDALVMNIGLHCMLNANFRTWQGIVNVTAAMLASLPTPHIFWRSSPQIMQHQSVGYHSNFHFFSEARRLIFDLYAEQELRRRGIRVIDVSALPANYSDFTHYDLIGNDLQNVVLANAIC